MARAARALAVVLALAAVATPLLWSQEYQWDLPKGFPVPHVPTDNPMTAAKVELGRHLFYDKRMSVNGKSSCATCHRQELAFTDRRAVSVGTTGELHSRSAMSLVNVAYAGALTWSNPRITELEDQALVPMYGEHPVELGLREGDGFIGMMKQDATYPRLFAAAFPDDGDRITVKNAVKAIACFERSIISARSPYDRYHYGGEDDAVPEAAKRGEVLFFNNRLRCFRCHGGFNFNDATVSERNAGRALEFHNTGLYNLAGMFSYPAPNLGTYEYTHQAKDVGKFKAPTPRNIAVTAPYMHDGSVATLEDVIDHYAAGGRTVNGGANAGVGHDNPNKDALIGGFGISSEERKELIAFLESLTDAEALRDKRWSNPW